MGLLSFISLTSTEGTTEVIEEVVEEVLQYNTDDIYRVLSDCSNKLSAISNQLDMLQDTGNGILQLLQDSFIESLVALLFMLVCFEIMKLVRAWMKGVILNGRNS